MPSDAKHLSATGQPIVITGAGLATSLGLSRAEVWSAIRAGRDGIAPLRAVESELNPNKGGGEVPPLPGAGDVHAHREVVYLRHVISAAIAEARLASPMHYSPARCAVILGTTLHGMRCGGKFLRTGDFAHLDGFLAGAVLSAALSDHTHRFAGPKITTCSACSSGLAAISLACTLLRSGELDCVLAGGYDAISEYSYAGFNCMRLVTSGHIRPFSSQRDGMKVAEGYGVVVLERESAARRRGAATLGRIAGIGESCDSHHLSKPHPEGDGAARAMFMALKKDASVNRAVDFIVAHATSTPDNDAAEYAALRQVFGENLALVPVVAFKSYFGHTLGGAGAVELILALSALADGVIPRTLHVAPEEVAYPGLTLPADPVRGDSLRRALCTSLGFGGANVALVVESVQGAGGGARAVFGGAGGGGIAGGGTAKKQHVACITGIGLLLPASLKPHLDRGKEAARCGPEAQFLIDDILLDSLLHAQRVRRMSRYAKLTLAAAARALADAGLPEVDPLGPSGGAIVATTHGSAGFCHSFYQQIISEGVDAANPLLFSEGVPNVGAAHVSTAFGIRGFCQTIIGTRTAGLDALRLAGSRIQSGEWSRALVVAAEEYSEIVENAYQFHRVTGQRHSAAHASDFVMGEGGVAIILESMESAQQRGARVRGALVAAEMNDCSEVVYAGGRGRWARAERVRARGLLRTHDETAERISTLPDDWPDLCSMGPLVALTQWLGGVAAAVPRRAVCLACDGPAIIQSVVVKSAAWK